MSDGRSQFRLSLLRSFRSSHHYGEILEGSSSLINNLVESFCWSDRSDDYLVISRCETIVCSIGERVKGHAQLPPLLITHVVMQFSLHTLAKLVLGRHCATYSAQEVERFQ